MSDTGLLRFYRKITPDKKIELSIYPSDSSFETGNSQRLTKQDAQNLISILQESIKELEAQE